MVKARLIKNETIIEIEAVSEVKRVGVYSAGDHSNLTGRKKENQHPIGAITGLQDALLEKQDVIRDLSEIRQGATLGATAVQPSDLESYATKDYVDDGLSGKQDTLTAGANIQIVGNTISATNTWGNITGILSAQTDLWNVLEEKANVADIPTATSDLLNDSGFITLSALTPYATQTWVENKGYLTEIPAEYVTDSELTAKGYQTAADVETAITAKGYTTMSAVEAKGYITNAALVGYATESWVTNQNYITGDYVGNAVLTIQKNGTNVDTFTANATVDKIINITVPTTAAEVNALSDSTKYGASIDLSLNTTDYKLTLTLKDQDGNVLKSVTVDFPIESVVVNGSYDSINQKIVLTLQNGNTIDIPVGALIAGLQTEITVSNKLDADLVDDSTSTNKFVTSSDKTTWNGKQDAISDLSAIRTNATNGASAYTTIQGYGNIVTHNVSEFATSAQGALADSAVQPSDLATVATSGSYNDLINKPTNVSAFTNDAGYITNSALNGYATESYVTTATANMQTTGNLVTSISSTSTNEQYASAKCVYDIVGDIESAINTIRGV